MRTHDHYARVTPYEMALPGRAFARERFELIRDEAARRSADIWDPGAFSMLEQAGRVIGEIRDEDGSPVLFVHYGVILFHAFHFWSAGEPLYLLRTGAARELVGAGSPSGAADWDFAAPSRAGYLQLPDRLFWARPEADGPAEPIDGFFWVFPRGGQLHLMAASGMRAGRAGFGVMPLPGIPGGEAGRWAATTVRERGGDFESTLPGGEELFSVETPGEVVKLVGRLFWRLERGLLRAGAPEPGGRSEPRPSPRGREAEGRGRAPLPSALPYRPIPAAEAV